MKRKAEGGNEPVRVSSFLEWYECNKILGQELLGKGGSVQVKLRQGYAGILDLREGGSSSSNVPISESSIDDSSSKQFTITWENHIPYSLQVPLSHFTVKPCSRWAELPPRHLKLAVILAYEDDIPTLMKYFVETLSSNTLWTIEYWVWNAQSPPTLSDGRLNDMLVLSEEQSEKWRRSVGWLGGGSRLPAWCCNKRRNLGDVTLKISMADRNASNVVLHQRDANADVEVINISLNQGTIPWCLWKPNIVLDENIHAIENHPYYETLVHKRAIDLGCGSGRDCVFLARRGWEVIGVDHVQKCIDRAKAFAERHGVHDKCSFIVDKIDNLPNRKFARPNGLPWGKNGGAFVTDFDLVVICRTIIEDLNVVDRLLQVFGVVVYHHFLEGATHPDYGKLERGKLRKYFSAKGYQIERDEECRDASDGRPLSYFVARKMRYG